VRENLFDNAWKFTSKREHASIRFAAEHDAEDLVDQVKDDDAGFEAAYAHRLFAPFQRLHAAEQFPGTGVGLATVQRIVRRHGGRGGHSAYRTRARRSPSRWGKTDWAQEAERV
jgi:light-regulated signal transduction histidine kinase (bacteriophytochrome)